MLVLSRKLGQELVLDGRIRVFVLGMRSGSVRLGIEAPTDVSIVRPKRDLVGARHAEAASEANVVSSLPKRPR